MRAPQDEGGPETSPHCLSRVRALAQKDAAEHALSRTERVAAIFLFTMSNTAVFFVPAARCCVRVLLFSFPSAPNEGRAERRKAQAFCCRARDARRSALPEARRASSGTRSPLGAPPWRFWAGG